MVRYEEVGDGDGEDGQYDDEDDDDYDDDDGDGDFDGDDDGVDEPIHRVLQHRACVITLERCRAESGHPPFMSHRWAIGVDEPGS